MQRWLRVEGGWRRADWLTAAYAIRKFVCIRAPLATPLPLPCLPLRCGMPPRSRLTNLCAPISHMCSCRGPCSVLLYACCLGAPDHTGRTRQVHCAMSWPTGPSMIPIPHSHLQNACSFLSGAGFWGFLFSFFSLFFLGTQAKQNFTAQEKHIKIQTDPPVLFWGFELCFPSWGLQCQVADCVWSSIFGERGGFPLWWLRL